MEETKEKILPITIQKEFNNILGYAFPLCILLSNEKNLGWYYENYIETYAQVRKGYQIRFDITDVLSYSEYESRLLEKSQVDFIEAARISDIVKEVCRKIDNNKYIIIFLDQYYIKNNKQYESKHFPHEVLIYGYNDEVFKAIAFDKNKIFTGFDISYEELKKGFAGVLNKKIWTNDYNLEECIIMYFNLVDHIEYYPFSKNNFTKKLNRYYNSKMNEEDFYLKKYIEQEDQETVYSVMGIDTYDIFIDYFKEIIKLAKNNPKIFLEYIEAKYTFIHLFAQHKEGLYKRFEYIQCYVYNSEKLEGYIQEYQIISQEVLMIRLDWLKLIKKMNIIIYDKNNIEYAKEYSIKIVSLLLKRIKDIKNKEKNVIKKILDELELN